MELKDLAEAELMKQLDKKNMVELVYIGDLFNAKKIFEAALKLTKSNMTWLRSQVCLENEKIMQNLIHALLRRGALRA